MKPIETLTDDQSNALLTAFPSLRDRALALLLLDAGLRVGEAVQLSPKDILPPNLNNREHGLSLTRSLSVLVVPTTAAKNHRSRLIPMTNRLQEALHLYLLAYSRTHRPTLPPWLFPSRSGTHHLTTRQARRIIQSTALRALARNLHPHVLRHTFATNMMRNTDLPTLQLLLGHKSLSSTQVYTHPTVEDLRQAILKFQNHNPT